MATKPYLGEGTLEALIKDIHREDLDFYYKRLNYHINDYPGSASIQVIDQFSDPTVMVQDEIYYPSVEELLNNYKLLDGTPILEVLRDNRVDPETWI